LRENLSDLWLVVQSVVEKVDLWVLTTVALMAEEMEPLWDTKLVEKLESEQVFPMVVLKVN